ncbi:MAG: proton-conducting transporter membrane subunit [Verrucomicrobia bacterium]|nr:proton-conducting transporter membrane subunit [Verrucomicrobiota bacterium]
MPVADSGADGFGPRMSNGGLFLIVLGLPLLLSVLVAGWGSRLGRRVGWLALGAPLVSTAGLLALAGRASLPGRWVFEWPWIPSLGIHASFLVDGLSLFFGLVVSGMGVLVVFYATAYLDNTHRDHGRFHAYLILFMVAMLGTVLANNLMLLFVFWELTGLASFLLIGFLHGEEHSRVGARQALLVTGFTGLLLLVGLLMVRQVAGTFDLHVLLTGTGLGATEQGWLTVALGLMLLGAFGKSAQFPFHFWLPNAMAAPTPVSAYLHSATMVKLGVFLCARLFPLFVGNALWAPLLSWVAFGTMLLGALGALWSHDLKALLAYSTVSQLGYLIGYYGLGPTAGVEYDYLHILNHVFYKGCLFMVAGVVIHSTGVQDIRRLGGLGRRMPVVGATCALAAATMAGLPGTTGFLSKELMLHEIFGALANHGALGAYAIVCVGLTSVVKVAFSLRLFSHVFLGRPSAEAMAHYHAPSWALQLPPALLALAAVVLGVAPGWLDGMFVALRVAGLHQAPAPLAVWHGLTPELLVSVGVVLGGLGLYAVGQRTRWAWGELPRWLQLDVLFEQLLQGLGKTAKGLTRGLGADRPLVYLPVLLVFLLVVVGGRTAAALVNAWREGGGAALGRGGAGSVAGVCGESDRAGGGGRGGVAALDHAAHLAVGGRFSHHLLLRAVPGPRPRVDADPGRSGNAGAGAGVARAFPAFGGGGRTHAESLGGPEGLQPGRVAGRGRVDDQPGAVDDLAPASGPARPVVHGAHARTGRGWEHREHDSGGLPRIRHPGRDHGAGDCDARGAGVVDAVQANAGGVSGRSAGPAGAGDTAWRAGRMKGPESTIFNTVARLVFFLVNVFALYLLLRGHNLPGGGFIAGLVSAISLVLLSLGLGVEAMHRILRFDPVRVAAVGLGVAVLTGLAPGLVGRPFLEHFQGHWRGVPWLYELHVGTPLLFDVGVYLVVLGITCKMVFVFTKSTQGLRILVQEEEARYSSPVEQPIETVPGRDEGREAAHAD